MGVGGESSYSIPIVYRWHQDLWEKNRATLAFAMREAREKLRENEVIDNPEDQVVLEIVSQMAILEMSE